VPSPAHFWGEISRSLELSYSVGQVAASLIGLPEDQLEGEVDWNRPMTVVVYPSPSKRLSSEAMAVVIGRPEGAIMPPGGADERTLSTSKGTLHLLADQETIALSASRENLAPARAEARELCSRSDDPRPQVTLELSPRLLDSPEVVSWVARQGAWLEASARQATARMGRSTLGDPEALARMLARYLEEIRGRAREAAPLRLELNATGVGVMVDLIGGRSPLSDDAGGSPTEPPPLALVPPDAYLVIASWTGSEPRRAGAQQLVESWARVAGDRLPDDERQQLETLWTGLAAASDGWVVLTLRPALEPGPVVALASVEARDPSALIDSLTQSVEALDRGYLRTTLEHLGTRVELAERRDGELGLRVTPPEGDEGERGSVVRTLTGESPTLAWRVRGGGRVLIAFGPDPERELDRMVEASEAPLSSILSQPLLADVVEAHPSASFVGYGWTPGVGALVTRGAPSAQGLPEGGVALATGMSEDRWRAAIHLGPDQVRAVIGMLASEERP
jgi:hypothetical protein